ncbi:hypothetical protein [Pseudomonas sp. 2FE]|uniref:hypothetical protein n=1 Tax=Pseudomonas sp. 2FE TaxID=2502190 RepID=UPI0010F897A3|nr:hypothetical protein [Pseudomonas sp. 2FE]
MQICSLTTLAKLRADQADCQFAVLSPKSLNLQPGDDPFTAAPAQILDFIEKNRWRHSYCMIGLPDAPNEMIEPGTVVMCSSRPGLMHYLLRWHALRVAPVWIDSFDTLPMSEQAERQADIDTLQRSRKMLKDVDGWYQTDEEMFSLAYKTLRTGYWDLVNLPPLDNLLWPSGDEFGLRNPALTQAMIEVGYVEGVFSMIERKTAFCGQDVSVPADKLFGVALMTPESGHDLMIRLHVQVESNRATSEHARRQRATA